MTTTQPLSQNPTKETFFGTQPIQVYIRKPRKHHTVQFNKPIEKKEFVQ